MIDKNNRFYIKKLFKKGQKFNDGDILVFDMPPFCSGDYSTVIHLDNDGDPYIDKSESYYEGCRDYYIRKQTKK